MENLVIIHGAIGATDQMIPLGDLLKEEFNVHYLEFSGHGLKADVDSSFTMQAFQDELKAFIDDLGNAHVFGYSMGGFVALLLASTSYSKITSITTLGTKMKWNEEIAEKESRMLNPEKIEEKVPAFAQALEVRHGSNWKNVLIKTQTLLMRQGIEKPINEDSMSCVQCPVQLLLGDQDEMVSKEETEEVLSWIPNASFSILSNSKHPIERVDLTALTQKITDFV